MTGKADRLLKGAPGKSHSRGSAGRAENVQSPECDLQAIAFSSERCGSRHTAIAEMKIADGMRGDHLQRFDCQSWGARLHHHSDCTSLLAYRTATEHNVEIGQPCVGNPTLGAVDGEMIAVAHSLGADVAHIRSCFRLRNCKPANQFSRGDLVQISALEFF